MAIGSGRFALTPPLPLMLHASQVTLTGAGLVAAARYLGYPAGASIV